MKLIKYLQIQNIKLRIKFDHICNTVDEIESEILISIIYSRYFKSTQRAL